MSEEKKWKHLLTVGPFRIWQRNVPGAKVYWCAYTATLTDDPPSECELGWDVPITTFHRLCRRVAENVGLEVTPQCSYCEKGDVLGDLAPDGHGGKICPACKRLMERLNEMLLMQKVRDSMDSRENPNE